MSRCVKFFIGITFLVFFQQSIYAQVGIGTTTPDPSSILDMTSTTQGMLTPRMTSAQRIAISNAVEGLMVFDIDENVFYFYDGSSWTPLGSAEKRNNYKLVKSAADLADELAAGGGSSYQLTSNTLYEINGTIVLAAPIDLNNAYITGRDTNEDILFSSGGTILSGTTGGSIRSLTLSAPGGTVFNLAGSVTDSLIFRDCVVYGSGSVGSLSGFGLVFMSIVQFVANTNGITYSNINQLLINSTGWDGSNGGTYETFVGTFDIIARQGGFSKVTTATAAIDVTGISSITGGASMSSVNFFGGGNYVTGPSPYTGYKFTRDWDVNCTGITVERDGVASGNLYYNGNLTTGFSQSIINNSPVKVEGNGTFTASNLFRFITTSGISGLVYDGLKSRTFQVNTSMSVRVTNGYGKYYAFLIAKNGNPIIESNATVYIQDNSQIQSVSINTNVTLAYGDYIQVFVQRLTGSGTDTLAVFSGNLSIR